MLFPLPGIRTLRAALLLATSLANPYAFADTNQAGAQNTASKVNHIGSDDSMEAATTSGMMALMNLAALNIGGAVSNGYKAYGEFMNSETLDDLEAQTVSRRNSMVSAGQAVNPAQQSTAPRATTFSRLDPGFLYKGQAGKVAEEFEKRSGMGRETFLKHLGSATDSGLSYGDPNLLEKLEARYQYFKSDVRNPEFLKGLERVETMVPHAARQKLLGEFRQMYLSSPSGTADMVAGMNAASPSPEKTREPASAPGASSAAAPASAPAADIGAESGLQPRAPLEGGTKSFLGIAGGDSEETLQELIGEPIGSENDTLFMKVSKRYRALTPTLVGQASMLRSH